MTPTTTYFFGPFALDIGRRTLLREGKPVALTPKAFDLLAALVKRGGVVVDKETILGEVWPDTVVDEGSLTFQISALRKALSEQTGGERIIATIPGRGYQLVVPVREAEAMEMTIEERGITTLTYEMSQREEGRSLRTLVWPVALVAVAVILVVFAVLSRRPPVGSGADRSLAVLPFKPIVGSQRDEALELGMADALIARISSLQDVTVRPLTAVRRYRGLEDDPLAAGRDLGVDSVLDGSIHSAGGRVRVVARLLRVTDGRQLWQGKFEVADAEIFGVQDAISDRIVGALALELTPDEKERLERSSTTSLEAYRAYSIGRLHMWRLRGDEIDEAIGHFKRAIELDPTYTLAHAALGDCYAMLPISQDRPSKPNFDEARKTIERLIALSPNSADAYAIRGGIRFWGEWDWEGAEADYRRALELNPNHSLAHLRYAHLLSNIGRHDESAREAAEALRLEPLSALLNGLAGMFRLQAKDYEGAIRQLEHTLEIEPDFWIAHLNLGKCYELMQRYDLAEEHYRSALERSDKNNEPLSMIGHLHGLRGQRAEAEKVASQLIAISKERYVPPTKIALIYAGMGDHAKAIEWLGKGCADRDVGMTFLNVNPRWDRLRGDPGFAAIERCVGLPR